MKIQCLVFASLAVLGCAHQSKVVPSNGHINGEPNTININQNADAAPIPKPIKASPVLPPPQATSKAQTYSVVVNEVPVKEILFALARESKLNIDIHPAIQGRVTLNAVDQTLPAILERLARQVDLTYKFENNVLYITPDQPVLRMYKVDYVNMSRDTKGFIGSASEISSTGQSASTGSGGQSASSSGNGANNSSRTSVDSVSRNHLWESLIQNIKDILAETDKEIIISRTGTASQLNNESANNANNDKKGQSQSDVNKSAIEESDRERSEYKTLFAANVIANPETGVISVRATNKQHEKVQEFIDKVMHSASKQVLIEATIVEVSLNDSFQSGIDWSRLNNPGKSGFVLGQTLGPKSVNLNLGNGATQGSAVGPNTAVFSQGDANALGVSSTAGIVAGYLNPVSSLGNIAASITLLKTFGDTKVLSSPKLMVLNNQTAVLKVVDNLVYFTVQAQQSQGTNGSANLSTITTTPNTVPVGVVMSVTPQINDGGNVNINVRPTISRVLGFVRDPNPQLLNIQSLIPQIQVREMESVLQVGSGNTAVLGGLMQDEIDRNSDKVPGLADVPGLGKVFTGRNDANKKTELVIFLRPTVISNASLESDELQTYKQYLPAQQLEHALEEVN
jgi:general secretion pathway protein D